MMMVVVVVVMRDAFETLADAFYFSGVGDELASCDFCDGQL